MLNVMTIATLPDGKIQFTEEELPDVHTTDSEPVLRNANEQATAERVLAHGCLKWMRR